jgi:hypothetical protein
MQSDNADIAAILEEIANVLENHVASAFRTRAYPAIKHAEDYRETGRRRLFP